MWWQNSANLQMFFYCFAAATVVVFGLLTYRNQRPLPPPNLSKRRRVSLSSSVGFRKASRSSNPRTTWSVSPWLFRNRKQVHTSATARHSPSLARERGIRAFFRPKARAIEPLLRQPPDTTVTSRQESYEPVLQQSPPEEEEALPVDRREQPDEETKDRAPVEFFILAPKEVGGDYTFSINVHIVNLPESDLDLDQTDATFQTLITEIQNGSRVGLVLLSRPATKSQLNRDLRISIDTPYQALTWSGRNLVATFNVQSPPSEWSACLQSRLWITIRGIDIGTIDVEVPLNPNAPQPWGSREHRLPPDAHPIYQKELQTHRQLSELIGQGRRALLFKTAFICYAHADKELADVFHGVIEAALSKCYKDDLDMILEPHWLLQASGWIDKVDVIYIMWSKAAETRPSIQQELDVIVAQKLLRERRAAAADPKDPNRPTQLTICVALLGGDVAKLPEKIRLDCGFTNRPAALRVQVGQMREGA